MSEEEWWQTLPSSDEDEEQAQEERQAWLADDASGIGKLQQLRVWWDELVDSGLHYGYYVNAAKTWIIVKNEETLEAAKNIFSGTDVKFTFEKSPLFY